jgi:hypothetical protein
MHGQFLLVQLESPDEAVLGRISSFSSEGKLSVGAGEYFWPDDKGRPGLCDVAHLQDKRRKTSSPGNLQGIYRDMPERMEQFMRPRLVLQSPPDDSSLSPASSAET